MAEITIYDSQGNPYGDRTGRASERIKNLFFGGVRVYVDIGSTTELIVFFRARESTTGRAEQYYAVYQTRNLQNLFRDFKSDLRRHLKREHGLSIESSGKDSQVFEKLETSGGPVPGTDHDHGIIERLLKKGKRMRFGVSGVGPALGLFNKYLQGEARSIAIAENTDIDELNSCDFAIEIGNYRQLEPLGQTKDAMDQERRQHEEQFVQQKIRSIKEDVADLRSHTTKSEDQIRNRLKRDLSIFDSPPPKSSRNSGILGPLLSGSGTPRTAVIVGLVLVIGLLTAGVIAVAFVGVPLPFIDSGGDDVDSSLHSNVFVNGTTVEPVAIGNRSPKITARSDGEVVYAVLEMENGGEARESMLSNETESEVDGAEGFKEFRFPLNLSEIDEGEGTVTIGIGTHDDPFDDEERFETKTKNVTVDFEEEDAEGAIIDGENAGDGSTENETTTDGSTDENNETQNNQS